MHLVLRNLIFSALFFTVLHMLMDKEVLFFVYNGFRKKVCMDQKELIHVVENDIVDGYFVIKELRVATSKKGDEYIRITLGDKTGSIAGTIFDLRDIDVEEWMENGFVKAYFRVGTYNDKPQANFESIESVSKEDVDDLSQLIETAPLSKECMIQEIQAMIDGIEDVDYKYMVNEIYQSEGLMSLFTNIPAGKTMHHDYLYGLLYHTYRMSKAALALASVYTNANKDLLLAGTLCHDIGKVYEFDLNSNGLVEEYSKYGNLLGHIYMGANYIARMNGDISCSCDFKEKKLLLQHMLLAHHGKLEYGAVKVPSIFEAYLLHTIDLIDSRADMFEHTLMGLEPGQSSAKVFGLETCVYKPDLKEE